MAILATFTAVVIGLWVRHGGWSDLHKGWSLGGTSVTQLSGLLASAIGLVGLALVSRPRSVERRFGLDRLFVWHRILGETMTILVGVHIAAGIVAWSVDDGVFTAVRSLTGGESYMALATVGSVLIAMVTITSLASIRRKLSYETWWFLHLTAYVGFAASFGHEVVLGGDFSSDTIARWFWIAIHVVVLVMLVLGRWGTTLRAACSPLRVVSTQRLGPDAVSVRLGGRRLKHIEARSGQFFLVRPLRRGWWWQAHPFSLSAAPSPSGLRFTIKSRGDASSAMAMLPTGTAVALEGPYGTCTPDRLHGRKVLFIAGGVGVAPVRAMLETLEPGSQPVVLFRANHKHDLLHLDEVRGHAESRGGQVRTLVGPSHTLAVRDPFAADKLLSAVPDLRDRVAVVCGPPRLLAAARAGLRAAGVAPADIHYERPWW